MANKLIIIFFLGALSLSVSCNKSERIIKRLNSNDHYDLISGSYDAGESGDKKFMPDLLKKSDDPRVSTNLKYKGISVYQAKMIALKKIFKAEPPVEINRTPDSTVIRFYAELYEKENK